MAMQRMAAPLTELSTLDKAMAVRPIIFRTLLILKLKHNICTGFQNIYLNCLRMAQVIWNHGEQLLLKGLTLI